MMTAGIVAMYVTAGKQWWWMPEVPH